MSFEHVPHRPYVKVLSAITTLALTASGCGETASSSFNSGCKPSIVYAQNRWVPYGAAERNAPDLKAQKIGGYSPNEAITVDGWLHSGSPVYPNNQAPFNNDVWFHDANKPHGYISFAGVRAALTRPDTTLEAAGGPPAPLTPDCEVTFKK